MSKFVAVRVVQANAMELKLFQFDYDMSFAVTFLHPDRTVYAIALRKIDPPVLS